MWLGGLGCLVQHTPAQEQASRFCKCVQLRSGALPIRCLSARTFTYLSALRRSSFLTPCTSTGAPLPPPPQRGKVQSLSLPPSFPLPLTEGRRGPSASDLRLQRTSPPQHGPGTVPLPQPQHRAPWPASVCVCESMHSCSLIQGRPHARSHHASPCTLAPCIPRHARTMHTHAAHASSRHAISGNAVPCSLIHAALRLDCSYPACTHHAATKYLQPDACSRHAAPCMHAFTPTF